MQDENPKFMHILQSTFPVQGDIQCTCILILFSSSCLLDSKQCRIGQLGEWLFIVGRNLERIQDSSLLL
jgi:hypothetical protein